MPALNYYLPFQRRGCRYLRKSGDEFRRDIPVQHATVLLTSSSSGCLSFPRDKPATFRFECGNASPRCRERVFQSFCMRWWFPIRSCTRHVVGLTWVLSGCGSGGMRARLSLVPLLFYSSCSHIGFIFSDYLQGQHDLSR